jgi:hypothetical protein
MMVVVVVVIVVLLLLLAVLQLHPVVAFTQRTSKSLVVGLQPHGNTLSETARIPAAVHVDKDAAEDEEHGDQESGNDGGYLE